jgi:hypothetical protein
MLTQQIRSTSKSIVISCIVATAKQVLCPQERVLVKFEYGVWWEAEDAFD